MLLFTLLSIFAYTQAVALPDAVDGFSVGHLEVRATNNDISGTLIVQPQVSATPSDVAVAQEANKNTAQAIFEAAAAQSKSKRDPGRGSKLNGLSILSIATATMNEAFAAPSKGPATFAASQSAAFNIPAQPPGYNMPSIWVAARSVTTEVKSEDECSTTPSPTEPTGYIIKNAVAQTNVPAVPPSFITRVKRTEDCTVTVTDVITITNPVWYNISTPCTASLHTLTKRGAAIPAGVGAADVAGGPVAAIPEATTTGVDARFDESDSGSGDAKKCVATEEASV